MSAVYGVVLDTVASPGGRAYLSLSGTWQTQPSTPMVFKKKEDAEAEAFGFAMDPEYFGRVRVIRLVPTVSRWVDGSH